MFYCVVLYWHMDRGLWGVRCPILRDCLVLMTHDSWLMDSWLMNSWYTEVCIAVKMPVFIGCFYCDFFRWLVDSFYLGGLWQMGAETKSVLVRPDRSWGSKQCTILRDCHGLMTHGLMVHGSVHCGKNVLLSLDVFTALFSRWFSWQSLSWWTGKWGGNQSGPCQAWLVVWSIVWSVIWSVVGEQAMHNILKFEACPWLFLTATYLMCVQTFTVLYKNNTL